MNFCRFGTNGTLVKRKQWRKIKRTLTATSVAVGACLLLIAIFLLPDRDVFRVRSGTPWLFWQLKLITASIQALTVIWIFAFASAVGSFLNVVVWRMPRG
jgi:hypothetical protein